MQLKVDTLPDPGDRFELGDEIGTGSWAKVIKAIDKQSNGRTVAIKTQSYDGDQRDIIDDEYRVLRDYSDHPNLLKLYGVYRKKVSGESDQIWFVLEYCEGGSVIDFVNRLHSVNRRISEEHISYILKEAATGLAHLHKNHYVHRDIRGSNILLTSDGEVKLVDYGLSRSTGNTVGRRNTCIGSPCWMAPEMFGSTSPKKDEGLYSNKIDVWSLGITAIEIGDGVAPFLDMHPTRAMFQIVRNPPPTLYRPANWSQNYNDFIAECLEKNQDNRPFIVELLEHPFFQELIGASGSTHHLSCELKQMLAEISAVDRIPREEISILKGCIKKFDKPLEKMFDEDLCAIDNKLSEEKISEHLKYRLANGDSYTFVGDVLLSINSNEMPTEFPRSFHFKYACKSRSDNAPHIFTVADSAYQDMLHHEEHQNILFAGESYSGKTTQMKRAVDHLCILGEGNSNCNDRVKKAIDIVHQLVNAGTPVNPDSTRCCLQAQLTFGSTGKLSGVIFDVFLLEKLRVSSTDMDQSNFHIFYYFYDSMGGNGALDLFKLEAGRKYRYFRAEEDNSESKLPYCRYDIQGNISKFQEFEANLKLLDFDDDQINSIRRALAAILILGNVRFSDDGKFATIETKDEVLKVAQLLEVDEKKFEWSLVNYCLIRNGAAEKRKHTIDEARDARDVLAATIYCRLVDWIVNIINQKFALGRAVFGDMHIISLTDMFGFECLHRNRYEQLVINSLNEQLQYHYNQRMFAWEMLELEEEQIPHQVYKYHDNKPAVDDLMMKPNGLFYLLDDATRDRLTHEFVIDTIANKKATHIQRGSSHEFSVAHYTGKVTYDVRDMADKNRDFVPPEMVETLRMSKNEIVKVMFTNPLSKTGNLTVAYDQPAPIKNIGDKKSKWGAALMAEKQTARRLNTLSHGQYSQVHKMRTLCGVFRATSLEILKGLSIGGNSGNTHFVRCIRSTLNYKPRAFQSDMVHQQLRALAILDTAIARQKGFPQRICFQEFLRRYKFLAFEFDENVELTKDNCRLLLIRLKMEGWAIGKTKVFLKYYNVEYLSRLYETQVKKIIKVQCMMRAFLAKRNVAIKLNKFRQESMQKDDPPQSADKDDSPADDSAAVTIQKAYRGYKVREQYGPLLNSKTGNIDAATSNFIKPYAKRWKTKSVFQVLLLYRAARYQDFVNLTQQIHLYNQAVVSKLKAINECMILDKVDEREQNPALLGPARQAVRRLPFRLDEIPFYDTSYMCDPINGKTKSLPDEESDQEDWDTPLRRTTNVSSHITKSYAMPSDYDDTSANSQNYQRVIPSHNVTYNVETIPIPSPSPSRPTVYKRRPSSPLPNTYVAPTIRNETPERSVVSDDLNKAIGKLNPVREMELLARNRSADNEDGDTPPFNFQGMLRKTNHQRASMKRSRSENNNNSMCNGNIVYHSQELNGSKSSTKVNFGFDVNDNVPPPIAPRIKTAPPVPSERKSSVDTNSFGTYVNEEIHPGVFLEGYAVEL